MIETQQTTCYGLYTFRHNFFMVQGSRLLKSKEGNHESILEDDMRAQIIIKTLPTYLRKVFSKTKMCSILFLPGGQ